MTKDVAAVSGHVRSCFASDTASAPLTKGGNPRRRIIPASGDANPKIAATHENDNANETLVTDAGRRATTTIAAAASAFQEIDSRPAARARNANENIVAARSDGKCAPLNSAYAQMTTIAPSDAPMRPHLNHCNSAAASAATTPRCKPAVTSTWTVPVS